LWSSREPWPGPERTSGVQVGTNPICTACRTESIPASA